MNRITVINTVCHQGSDGTATSSDCKFAHVLSIDEQPYCRTLKVGEEWQLVDMGWLTGASMVVLENKGLATQVKGIPTFLQKAEAAEVVVYVGVRDGGPDTQPYMVEFAKILPGHCNMLTSLGGLYVRCRKGTVKLSITAFPE